MNYYQKTEYDFESKYKTKGIGQFLINKFYSELSHLISSLDQSNWNEVLEVGCGIGQSTSIIAPLLKPQIKFQATDVEERLIQTASLKNPSTPISYGDIYQLQFATNSMDLVISLEVIEHLENPQKALQNLKKITKKYVILSVPREPIWCFLNMCRGKYLKNWGNTPGHIQHFSKNAFIKFVSSEFKILEVKSPLPWTIILAEKK